MKNSILALIILSFLPSSSFAENSSQDVVVDNHNQLIWQGGTAIEKEHGEAMLYCRDLTYAGKEDWRLPNLNELLSAFWISDKFKQLETYWSSTTHEQNTDYKWYVDFGDGDIRVEGRGGDNLVRCVRNNK